MDTADEPVEVDVAPPRTPRSEPTPENRPIKPDLSSHHPTEERPESSTPQSRPSLRINVTLGGVREVTTNESMVVPPNSAIPSDATPNILPTVWTSLSDYERILRRTRD